MCVIRLNCVHLMVPKNIDEICVMSMGGEYGRGIWERNLKQELARGIWDSSMGEESGRGIWGRKLGEEYGRGKRNIGEEYG